MRIFNFFLIFLLAGGCSNGSKSVKSNIIDLESAVGTGSVEKLSSYAKDISYIALESNSESFIGNIRKVDFSNGIIYIQDEKGVIKLFSDKGKYLSTFNKKGRGSGEYINMATFRIEPMDGSINVIDEMGKVYKYDSDFNFVKLIPFVDEKIFFSGEGFHLLDNNRYLITKSSIQLTDPASGVTNEIILYDDSAKIHFKIGFVQKNDIHSHSEGGKVISLSYANFPYYISRFKNLFTLITPIKDTIYSLNNNGELSLRYTINYGKYSRPVDKDIFSFEKTILINNFIVFKPPLFESEDFIFFEFNMGSFCKNPIERVSRFGKSEFKYRETEEYAIFNKKTGKLTFLDLPEDGKRGMVEDIKNGPPFWPQFTGTNGEFISYMTALDFLALAEKPEAKPGIISEVAAKIKEDDNPVIIISYPK